MADNTASSAGIASGFNATTFLKFAFGTVFFWGLVLVVVALTTGFTVPMGDGQNLVNWPTGALMMIYATVASGFAKVNGDI